MKVLVAFEFSGIVRDKFKQKGHDAWSCDLLPTERPGQHFQCDIFEMNIVNSGNWDLIIAHPPCTRLSVSGARWFSKYVKEQKEAIDLFMKVVNFPCDKICIENPIGIMSTVYRKPDQIIQPWQFGHGETKATCLWNKGLPRLYPSHIVEGREAKIHKMPPSPDRWKNRSRTYQGIANAMAEQWG